MSNIAKLVPLLESVYLGGIIDECVLSVKDGTVSVKAMDMTTSVYVQGSCATDLKDDQMGIGNMSLFIKYLRSYNSSEMEFIHNDNVLTVKPEGGSTLKYLLAETDFVPTYDAEWEDISEDPIETAIGNADYSTLIQESAAQEFLKLMSLFKPNTVTVSVSKRGLITLHGGNSTEHQFDVQVGKVKIENSIDPIKLYGANITAVFSVLDFTSEVTMHLVSGELLLTTEVASWVLRPISSAE